MDTMYILKILLDFRKPNASHKTFRCMRCLCKFSSEIILKKHELDCKNHEAQKCVLPKKDDKNLHFEN